MPVDWVCANEPFPSPTPHSELSRTGASQFRLRLHKETTPARALSVLIESEPGSNLLFDAFSSREPVSTSLENALIQRQTAPPRGDNAKGEADDGGGG
jgi:hypothetical protein